MSGKTPAQVDSSLREALKAWSGFEEPFEWEYLSVGLINQTWCVTRGSTQTIVQCVNEVFSPRVQDNIQIVSKHLEERGLVSPRLLETRDGALFAELPEGSRWRVMNKVPGIAFRRCESEDQARSAAMYAARFHNALSDFEAELSPIGFPFHDMAKHMADLQEKLVSHADHVFHSRVLELSKKIEAEVHRLGPVADLPRRVIHGDLKFNNFLFDVEESGESPRASALIDLDTLAKMPLYFDMGDAWRSWCNRSVDGDLEASLDMGRFRASAEGYLSTLGFDLLKEERLSLVEALERLSLELCSRFAADVLAESHWSWDPERFDSCAEHNWARAIGQWSLYQQARQTHAERSRFILG